MADVAQGATHIGEVTYVDHTGALIDPPDPRVDVLDPDGVEVLANAVPERVSLGRYTYDHAVAEDADLGDWVLRWTGTINGAVATAIETFTVVEPGEVGAGLGATIDGVRRLIPETPIRSDTPVDTGDVTAWLAEYDAKVTRRLGTLAELDEAIAAALVTEARGLVHLAVASITEDANHPERIADANRYAAKLWERYEKGLDELGAAADLARSEDAEGLDAGEDGVGAGSFPEPTVWPTNYLGV